MLTPWSKDCSELKILQLEGCVLGWGGVGEWSILNFMASRVFSVEHTTYFPVPLSLIIVNQLLLLLVYRMCSNSMTKMR